MHRTASATIVRLSALVGIALGFTASSAPGEVRLPHVIGSNMVLQRDMRVPIWGWAEPNETVTIQLGEHKATTQADKTTGKWRLLLPATPAGGPHELVISGSNTLTLTNILFGDVWLCSGQSNMEMGINSVANGEQEVANANYPQIRLFQVPWKAAPKPLQDVDATWRECSPKTIGTGGWFGAGFSAVAYFFGREIHTEVGVPIGLIDSSWGGTKIEPWTPPIGFASVPPLHDIVAVIKEATPNHEKAIRKAVEDYSAWLPTAREALDAGNPVAAPPAWPKHPLDDNGQPTSIYNGMIHPLIPFAIRGAIWYQGESNHPDGLIYHEKMKALINGWRMLWGVGDFPFYFVQLAPFKMLYQDGQIPLIWEAQTASLSIPNTGMAVTVDIGDLNDIHPKNKQDVGKRLALWALAKTYGRSDLVYSGPLYKSMVVEGNTIRITFDHTAGGLASRDGKPLNWFTIAGADKQFVDATATLDGGTVVVSSDNVAEPVAVRFGWSHMAEPNLMNKEGLPASPFRTDSW